MLPNLGLEPGQAPRQASSCWKPSFLGCPRAPSLPSTRKEALSTAPSSRHPPYFLGCRELPAYSFGPTRKQLAPRTGRAQQRDLRPAAPKSPGRRPGAMAGWALALRVATLLTGLLECLGFAGVLFGWASLVFVLKTESYFGELCAPDTGPLASATEQAGEGGAWLLGAGGHPLVWRVRRGVPAGCWGHGPATLTLREGELPARPRPGWEARAGRPRQEGLLRVSPSPRL